MTSLALLAALAAHPGHGTTDPGSLRHYVTEPEHLVPLALVLVAAIILVYVVTRVARDFGR